MNKYYIISNKYTNGYVRTFFMENYNGYTINLDEAGIYFDEDIKKSKYPLNTKNNLKDKGKYDTFFINIDDVELLGKRMTCILN